MTGSMERVEADLRAVGLFVSFPETPDVAIDVMKRVASPPSVALPPPRFRVGFAIAATVAVAVALVTYVGVSPSARRAVAGWLGVDGIRITFDDVGRDEPVGTELFLGSPVTADQAADEVDFEIAIPSALGEPDAYFTRTDVNGGEVSLVWAPRPDLPASEHTGVGAVLTQFLGETAPESLKKTADPQTTVTPVSVGGNPGYFIEGAPHLLVRDPSGRDRTLSPRLAGNTLLWDGGDVTYRLEAEVGLERALEIARSVRH